jgi:hypothetical protein
MAASTAMQHYKRVHATSDILTVGNYCKILILLTREGVLKIFFQPSYFTIFHSIMIKNILHKII